MPTIRGRHNASQRRALLSRANRRAEVASLNLAGLEPVQIAEKLEQPVKVIGRDLDWCIRTQQERALGAQEEFVARSLATLQDLDRRADVELRAAVDHEDKQRWMEQRRKLHADQRALLGLDRKDRVLEQLAGVVGEWAALAPRLPGAIAEELWRRFPDLDGDLRQRLAQAAAGAALRALGSGETLRNLQSFGLEEVSPKALTATAGGAS